MQTYICYYVHPCPFVGCFAISYTTMSYEAMLTKFITTLNNRIMPNSVLYANEIYNNNRKTLGSCLIECFIHFKLADQHAYSSMHDKKALSTKAQV